MRIALDPVLVALAAELTRRSPEHLGHIDPARILFVSGAARLDSRASIRPLTYGGSPPRFAEGGFEKPRITVGGVSMLYEICLRPRFFLAATAAERTRIIAHELWHIAPAFDGTLAADRRHEALEGGAIEAVVDSISARAPAVEAWAHATEATMRAWSSRPPSRLRAGDGLRRAYDERDLYEAVVLIR